MIIKAFPALGLMSQWTEMPKGPKTGSYAEETVKSRAEPLVREKGGAEVGVMVGMTTTREEKQSGGGDPSHEPSDEAVNPISQGPRMNPLMTPETYIIGPRLNPKSLYQRAYKVRAVADFHLLSLRCQHQQLRRRMLHLQLIDDGRRVISHKQLVQMVDHHLVHA